ncbi:MAG TPA: hypothetical protein VFD11_09780 [Thiopseudomonas sp.]|nr:hypothetical protein [Thiopseudomonas sp.]
MRIYITLVFAAFLLVWLVSIALFAGAIPYEWLPEFLTELELPSNFAHLGEAMGTLDGLFSSIAIVLGLIAILFQGRELKASTDAQALQAQALRQQIAQQEASNLLGAYSVRLSYLTAEIEHMEKKIPEMVERADNQKQNGETQKAAELWEIIKRTREKQQRYRKQAEDIDARIQQLLG